MRPVRWAVLGSSTIARERILKAIRRVNDHRAVRSSRSNPLASRARGSGVRLCRRSRNSGSVGRSAISRSSPSKSLRATCPPSRPWHSGCDEEHPGHFEPGLFLPCYERSCMGCTRQSTARRFSEKYRLQAIELLSRPERTGPPTVVKRASVPQLLSLEAPTSPLSSRPKRSAVERSLCGCSFLEIQ